MMGKISKIYLDNNHLIGLLDRQNQSYKRLAELLMHNKEKFKLLISDILLLEQSNVFRETLLNRSENAKNINFSFLRNHKTIVQMELNYYFNAIEIAPETDNYFKVIKFPESWHFTPKQKKCGFYQLLKVIPERPLSKPSDILYEIFNDRSGERLPLKDLILLYHRNKGLTIAENNVNKVNEYTCPSLFFYLASWYYKDRNSTKNISRNDAFDSKHCEYIPYTDIFLTDRGNAHVAREVVKNFNDANENSVQTKIFSKCEELLNELD